MRPKGSVVILQTMTMGHRQNAGFNPGKEKAQSAADLIGAGVAWPQGIEGTDWADALMEWGKVPTSVSNDRFWLKPST